MTGKMAGGCQCGRVRYEVAIASPEAYLCHCRMCQRATGGFAASLLSVQQADVVWHGEPDWYDSSSIAQRPFCSACGTPLGFRFRKGSTKMDLTLGSLDDPAGFRPTHHFGTESIVHESWLATADLPRTRTDEYDVLVKKWQDAGGPPQS